MTEDTKRYPKEVIYKSPRGFEVVTGIMNVSSGSQLPIFRVSNNGEIVNGFLNKVKQCNSCGAVGKINQECEYCGNIVY